MGEDRFEIQFERSGGLAGASLQAKVDSAELPEADAEELRRLLDRVDLIAAQAPPRGADRFQYDIKVRHGGKWQSATAYDGSMSPELKALTDWLVAHARRPKNNS